VSEEQLYMFKVVVDMIAKYLVTDGLDLDFNIIGKVLHSTYSVSSFLPFVLTHTASYYVSIHHTLLPSSASYYTALSYTALPCPTLH
jgi:hypothetical protein